MLRFIRRLFRDRAPRNPRIPATRRRVTVHVEALQDRMLPSVTAIVNPSHVLELRGDHADNDVVVSIQNKKIDVVADGKHLQFEPRDVHQISFTGNDGDDRFINSTAISSVADGGAGRDRLIGGSARDVLVGGLGDDLLRGRQSNDSLLGGAGNDSILGEDGNDDLHGGAGYDLLSGGWGNDRLFGGAHNDRLAGDGDNDILFGEAGDDRLNGGSGVDRIDGGEGRDLASDDLGTPENNCESTELSARLRGGSRATGEAEFSPFTQAGVNFKVEVEHAAANGTYGVFVDGNRVGTLTTNAQGKGKLKLNVTTLTVQSGSIVSVKDLQSVTLVEGILAQASKTQNDHNDD